MKRGTYVPDAFAVGLVLLGSALLVFPSLRVAGALAVLLGIIYWLLMAALRLMRQ